QFANPDGGSDNSMKLTTMNTTLTFLRKWIAPFSTMAAILCVASGCSKAEKEKEAVVYVQTTPARRAPIPQVISAEAVVYPLEQATVAPKISSTIKKFYVQRSARVKKGQLLAELENKDLSAAAESTKGDFEQADANYVTTVDASLPQQIQKAQLDAVAAKSNFEAQQKVYESRKELFQQGSIPRKDLDSAEAGLQGGNPAGQQGPGLEGPVQGRVSLVSSALARSSRTSEVWIEATRPDQALRPRMTVQLSMTAKTVAEALVVRAPASYKN